MGAMAEAHILFIASHVRGRSGGQSHRNIWKGLGIRRDGGSGVRSRGEWNAQYGAQRRGVITCTYDSKHPILKRVDTPCAWIVHMAKRGIGCGADSATGKREAVLLGHGGGHDRRSVASGVRDSRGQNVRSEWRLVLPRVVPLPR
jgi:hypothetical protein